MTDREVSSQSESASEMPFATTRRGFIKTAAVVAVGAVSLSSMGGITGCTTKGGSKKSVSSGTFNATADGYGGEISVKLQVKDSVLEAVEVVGDLETEGLGARAVKLLPYRMVGTNSVDVDVISGATFTSMAIISAAKSALEEGGAELVAKEVAVTQNMKAGTYEGEAYGKWKKGTIEGNRFFTPAVIEPTKVSVEVSKDKIVSVKILETSETPGFHEPVTERIPATIVEQQSITVDAVTGCTMTTGAVLEGVRQCLEQAGADLTGFVSPTAKKKDAKENYTVDFAIVGTGGSATMAAMTLLDAGRKTINLEKCGKVGGLSSCASSLFCVQSDLQIAAKEIYDADARYKYMMNFTHWKTNGPLVRNVIDHSATVVNYLDKTWKQFPEIVGIQQVNIGRPCVAVKKGTAKIKTLYDKVITQKGGKLLLETTAKSLIVEGGKVVGVKAVKQDGTAVTVHAKAVLIATGGFGGNDLMLKEICGSSAFYLNGISRNTGDGINMVRAIGGHLDPETEPEFSEYCGNDKIDIFSGYLKYLNQPGFLTVNSAGERFVNEQMFMSSILENAGPCLAAAGQGFLIFTQSDVDKMVKTGILGVLSDADLHRLTLNPQQYERVNKPNGYVTLVEEIDMAIQHKQAWKANTLEELGKQAGFNTTAWTATLKDYLKAVETRIDVSQGKDPAMLHSLATGPFYAVRITPTMFGTLCGIKASSNCQALDEGYRIIEGLYMGGQDAGGYFASPYYSDAAGHSHGFSWISGHIAATHFLANNA